MLFYSLFTEKAMFVRRNMPNQRGCFSQTIGKCCAADGRHEIDDNEWTLTLPVLVIL